MYTPKEQTNTQKGPTYLLWVEDSDDLCDSSLVKCWNHITARGEELQLECLPNTQDTTIRY